MAQRVQLVSPLRPSTTSTVQLNLHFIQSPLFADDPIALGMYYRQCVMIGTLCTGLGERAGRRGWGVRGGIVPLVVVLPCEDRLVSGAHRGHFRGVGGVTNCGVEKRVCRQFGCICLLYYIYYVAAESSGFACRRAARSIARHAPASTKW